jgi:hypothetical protein
MYDTIEQLTPPSSAIIKDGDTGELASIYLIGRSLLTPETFIDRCLTDSGIFFHYNGNAEKWRSELEAIAKKTKNEPRVVAHLHSGKKVIDVLRAREYQSEANREWAEKHGPHVVGVTH